MEEFAAVRLAGCSVPGRVRLARPLTGGRWLVDYVLAGRDRPEQHELLVVDQALRPLWRLRPPPEFPYWLGSHAVADDLSLAALCLHRELRLVDHHGGLVARFPYPTEHDRGYARFTDDGHLAVRFAGRDEHLVLNADGEVVRRHVQSPLGEAGGCVFTADGRYLWAVVPHLLDREAQRDELWLIEVAPRRVLDRRAVASGARWVQLCRHPDGQAVGVCWAFTWDEPVCWAHPAGGRIQLRVPDVAGVLQDIHPGGREYLASTEWDEDAVAAGTPAELERRHYPDGALLERLAIAGVPPGGWTAGYLTGELLLVSVWSQSPKGNHQLAEDLLVGRVPLRVLGRVGYPASQDRPGAILGCHDGAWLTVSDGSVERWTLARAPSGAVDHQPSCA